MADTSDLKSDDENREGSNPSSGTFKHGDRVKYFYRLWNEYLEGEVTVVRGTHCKVLFDNPDGPEYWYYPKDELIKI